MHHSRYSYRPSVCRLNEVASDAPLLRTRLREALWPNFRADTARLRSDPSFLVLGAQNCGTAALWRYLGHHRQVILSTRRNVGYFADAHYRGADWYRSHFPLRATLAMESARIGADCITGESSSHYLWSATAAPRVKRELPNIKLVVLLRDPVERAWAHHGQNTAAGIERRNFARCIQTEFDLIERLERRDGAERRQREIGRKYSDRREVAETRDVLDGGQFGYVRNGMYGTQLRPWLHLFSPSQLCVIETEAFREDPSTTYRTVLDFLGLEHELAGNEPASGLAEGSMNIPPALVSEMRAVFDLDTSGLADRLGVPLRWAPPVATSHAA